MIRPVVSGGGVSNYEVVLSSLSGNWVFLGLWVFGSGFGNLRVEDQYMQMEDIHINIYIYIIYITCKYNI